VTRKKDRRSAGGRFTGAGALATREDVEVRFNSERNVLAVQGRDTATILASMSELEAILSDRFGINVGEIAYFYELQLDLRIEAFAPPTAVLAKAGATVGFLKHIEATLSQPVSLFTIRATGQGQDANDVDWLEVRIEPGIPDTNRYLFGCIVRNTDRQVVVSFLESSQQKVGELLEGLEAS
jgi:hypothetical protein